MQAYQFLCNPYRIHCQVHNTPMCSRFGRVDAVSGPLAAGLSGLSPNYFLDQVS